MARIDYPAAFQDLVRELRRLPGIGPRSAERIGLWLIQSRESRPRLLAEALVAAREAIKPCSRCGFFATEDLCVLCADTTRTGREICVVENATDILPLERTGIFRGLYHALGGRIAPLDNVGPEDLRIEALLERVRRESPSEVILALSADVEGEATANYLTDLLRPLGVASSRIAQGIPAGGGLEHADELTLTRALAGRIASHSPQSDR